MVKHDRELLFLIVFLVAGITQSFAEVVTVNISDDAIDIDAWTATIADLPGPDGGISFSEAIIATNNTPGADTVAFAIPEELWEWQWLYPGCAVILNTYTYYWRASETLVIDGRTQTAFTGDTNPDGAEVVIYQDEFYFNADGCAMYGFHDVAVSFTGSNSEAKFNTGGSDITLFGGSGSLVQNNDCGTIKIDRSSDNIIIGNTTTRVRVWGFGTLEPAENNVIGGPLPGDRNFITGYGTWNGEGLPSGTTIEIISTNGTVVENNWIGTTTDGMSQGNQASTQGIWFQSENNNSFIINNRIAGILGEGTGPHHFGELYGRAILISGSGSDFTISGNTIGLNVNDEPLLGSVTGIDVGNDAASTASNITIENNVIAGHLFNGITVGHDVPQVRISQNDIYGNASLGIDLVPGGFGFGVTPNDAQDADDGGNGLQNFPELGEASSSGNSLTISGTLQSSASGEFTLEFFESAVADPSGHGEGEQYLGNATVFTDASGAAAFVVDLPVAVDPNSVITATATLEPLGATSEFAAAINVNDDGGSGIPCGDITSFQARCNNSGSLQMRVRFNTSVHNGKTVDFTIDGSDVRTVTIANSRAQLALPNYGAGSHTIEVTGPAGCVNPVTVTCNVALGDGGNLFESENIPLTMVLDQNFPNPFNPSTSIRYGLNTDSRVKVKIFNSLGQQVALLVDEYQPAGYHQIVWDGRNNLGEVASAGLYIYTMEAGETRLYGKMLLLK